MNIKISPSAVSGTIAVPPSKSLAHRAIIAAGLANGTSTITGYKENADTKATIACMKQLGAVIEQDGDTLTITGTNPALLDHPVTLDCGESGSTLRFLLPVAAASGQKITFIGQGRLLSRPMGVYADLFARQSLYFYQSGEKIVVQGPIQPGLFEIPGDISSQFISGLLFAAPLLEGPSEIAVLPPYESSSYTALTVSMLSRFGIDISQPTSEGYIIAPGQTYQPASVHIAGDDSQAAFFAVLAALNHELTIDHIDPDSRQPDAVIFQDIKQAGALLERQKTSITVSPGKLSPFSLSIADCPDLGPILCVLASYIEGTSTITEAARLRIKESDRIEAMECELKKWGVDISSSQDTITITGKRSYHSNTPVIMDAHNDHRIVMALAVFTLCAASCGIIEQAQAVSKSYPGFFNDLKTIGAGVEVIE